MTDKIFFNFVEKKFILEKGDNNEYYLKKYKLPLNFKQFSISKDNRVFFCVNSLTFNNTIYYIRTEFEENSFKLTYGFFSNQKNPEYIAINQNFVQNLREILNKISEFFQKHISTTRIIYMPMFYISKYENYLSDIFYFLKNFIENNSIYPLICFIKCSSDTINNCLSIYDDDTNYEVYKT